MPLKLLYFVLTLLLAFDISAAETNMPKASSTNSAITPLEQIASSYATENVFLLADNNSLIIRLPNQHTINYGSILLLVPANRNPATLDIGQYFQSQLPKLGWEVFLLFHDSVGSHPNIEQYETVINQAIQVTQQQISTPLFVIAVDQAALSMINLTAKEAPNINAATLILPQPGNKNVNFPTRWAIPLFVISDPRDSHYIVKLRKTSTEITHKTIAHENLVSTSGPFITLQIHGFFKKIVQSKQ